MLCTNYPQKYYRTFFWVITYVQIPKSLSDFSLMKSVCSTASKKKIIFFFFFLQRIFVFPSCETKSTAVISEQRTTIFLQKPSDISSYQFALPVKPKIIILKKNHLLPPFFKNHHLLLGLNKFYSFIVIISSTNKHRKTQKQYAYLNVT